MFRNDPLESLKVSSTFDAIPFVREYLQKEIEGQLRTLLMDEVPVIIHRLSQRLWLPDYREKEGQELARNVQDPTTEEKPVDPLASPPQDPVDVSGNILDASQIAALSLDSGSEMHALFSQKNLLRLGALTDSHRTLSLFTPGIRDVVFRAWAGPTERGEMLGSSGKATPATPATPAMIRSHSYTGNSSTTYVFSDAPDAGNHSIRPTLTSFGSATSGLSHASSRHGKSHGGRKRKHRVVNLRKKTGDGDDLDSVSGESSTASGTMSSAPSVFGGRPQTPERREDELITPPSTPDQSRVQKESGNGTLTRTRRLTPRLPQRDESTDITPRASVHGTFMEAAHVGPKPEEGKRPTLRPSQTLQYPLEERREQANPSKSQAPIGQLSPSPFIESPVEGILGQAWMTKMASEIAHKVQDQKAAKNGFWDRNGEDLPPPAYGA